MVASFSRGRPAKTQTDMCASILSAPNGAVAFPCQLPADHPGPHAHTGHWFFDGRPFAITWIEVAEPIQTEWLTMEVPIEEALPSPS